MLETIHWQNLLVQDFFFFFFWYKKIGNFYLLLETCNLYLLWICWDVRFLSAIIWIVCAFLEICSFKFPIDNVKLSVRFPMALTSRRYQPCFNSDFYAPFHLVGFKLMKRSLRDVAVSSLWAFPAPSAWWQSLSSLKHLQLVHRTKGRHAMTNLKQC